jgi:hypothetical protein
MHKSNEKSEAGVPPSKELVEEMGKLMEESSRAGVLLAAEGVHPSSRGARGSLSPEASARLPTVRLPRRRN